MRHLHDSERYRDTDYLGDDAWIGPNEMAPHGFTTADEPPWWSRGPWSRQPFAGERAFDEDRGQGREYGSDFGLGYGRDYDRERDLERTRSAPYDRRISEGSPYDWASGEPSPWASLHSDARIHADVSDRLMGHIGPWADDIDIFVREGEVILVGVVEDPRLKYLAQDIADDVAGVVEVHNHLRVRSVDDTRFASSRQWTRGGS
jgi:hypothetical protein